MPVLNTDRWGNAVSPAPGVFSSAKEIGRIGTGSIRSSATRDIRQADDANELADSSAQFRARNSVFDTRGGY